MSDLDSDYYFSWDDANRWHIYRDHAETVHARHWGPFPDYAAMLVHWQNYSPPTSRNKSKDTAA